MTIRGRDVNTTPKQRCFKNGIRYSLMLFGLLSILLPSFFIDDVLFQQEQFDYNHIDSPDTETREESPLNIVLFYADDWTMKVMGKLNPYVKTPNIDRLADEGILFSNNCVTTSLCWVSRGTLLTGAYASRHGYVTLGDNKLFHKLPWNETLFPLLQSAGYYTGLVGKWHMPQDEPYMSMAWNWSRLYFGDHWLEHDGELWHVTELNRYHALEFMRQKPNDKPFALKVSFFATHAWDGHYPSYQPTNESKRDLYINDTIPMPKTAAEEYWKQLPYFFGENTEARARWRRRWEPDYYEDSIKDLYRMATEVDSVVGDVVAELKKQGVYNQTMLLFTTDNGDLHGQHGLAEKWFPFEESIRVPLVIVDPRMPLHSRGTVTDEWTLNIDLAPTMLGAAQIPASSFMQGRDLADLYLKKIVNWRKDWFYEFNLGETLNASDHPMKEYLDASFALVTKEWKYINWPQWEYEQLFHRSLDPYEEHDLLNVSGKPIQTTKLIYQTMKARYQELKDWVQSGHKV